LQCSGVWAFINRVRGFQNPRKKNTADTSGIRRATQEYYSGVCPCISFKIRNYKSEIIQSDRLTIFLTFRLICEKPYKSGSLKNKNN